MEFTQEHYKRAAVAYEAYRKQAGGKSLVTGEDLPSFGALPDSIRDAWAAVAIRLLLDADREIRSLKNRAEFGEKCYQDRCENAYVEQSVLQKAVSETARRCIEIIAGARAALALCNADVAETAIVIEHEYQIAAAIAREFKLNE
jgi:ATP-dependent protease Clp ATPase subunit